MKRCAPCAKDFRSWTAFGRHVMAEHTVDRHAFWRRANQIGDAPCVLVRSDANRWFLMVQDRLSL